MRGERDHHGRRRRQVEVGLVLADFADDALGFGEGLPEPVPERFPARPLRGVQEGFEHGQGSRRGALRGSVGEGGRRDTVTESDRGTAAGRGDSDRVLVVVATSPPVGYGADRPEVVLGSIMRLRLFDEQSLCARGDPSAAYLAEALFLEEGCLALCARSHIGIDDGAHRGSSIVALLMSSSGAGIRSPGR